MPQDKLFDFYNAIKQNPSITGLPDNYNDFKSAMADRGVSEKFFNALRSNKAITGLPQTFDAFEDGLGLKKKRWYDPIKHWCNEALWHYFRISIRRNEAYISIRIYTKRV